MLTVYCILAETYYVSKCSPKNKSLYTVTDRPYRLPVTVNN